MIRRKLIILVVALVAALGLKAQPNTLYFMEDVALRHHLNPSFMPSASWFFEIPIFPSFYGEVGNNILSMRDFRVKKNGVWSTVYAPMESPDKYYKRMANINNFDARFAWYILNGGFSFNENNYMTLDLSLKGDAYVFLPKDMFGGIMYGAENNRRYNLSNFAVESYVYGELAVGYMRKVSDQWTIGLKLKGLIGFAGIHSDIAKAYRQQMEIVGCWRYLRNDSLRKDSRRQHYIRRVPRPYQTSGYRWSCRLWCYIQTDGEPHYLCRYHGFGIYQLE